MSVRLKMILMMLTTVVIVATLIMTTSIALFSDFVGASFENNLERTTFEVLNEIDLLQDSVAHIAATYFANDPALINAIEYGRYHELIDRAEELFIETGIEMFTVTDSAGRVIAQPHSPDFTGFYLTAMRSIIHALRTETPIATVEGGSGINLMVSASSPVFGSQNEIIGVVLVGFRIDTERFVDRHRLISGAEIAMFRGSESVATTLVVENGSRAVGMVLSEEIRQTVFVNREVFSEEISLLGHDMAASFTPIFDAHDNVVASLFVGYFLYERVNVIQTFVVSGAIITAVIAVLSILIVSFVAAKVAKPISKRLDQIYIDALTGAYNRRYIDEKFYAKIETLSRSNDELSLILVDIDFFKKYNDTYGHAQGDECLKLVAKALMEAVSREGDFVARYGGEEFIAVFPNTDEKGAHIVAQKLINSIYNCNIPHATSEISDRITISAGVVTGYTKDIESLGDFLKRADELLYISKQNGRNQYTFRRFDEKLIIRPQLTRNA